MKHFLIVVDMQKDFVDGALGTAEAQAIVGNVMDKILNFDGQIFATLDTHTENYLQSEKVTFGSVLLPRLLYQAAAGEPFTAELVGLCTDICVVSNALMLKANFPEMEITVDSRCCAGVTPETHAAALTTMACCQINVK